MLWSHPQHCTPAKAAELAWCIPLPHDAPSDYVPGRVREQLADRYGGIGVGPCGGSARCGILDGVQIKGVGRNGLFGLPRGGVGDPWHSNGTLTLTDAARECIWSTICEFALPHGAVPSLAILATGTRASAAYAQPGSEQDAMRTLLLRVPALRPAHFMRNTLFAPANQNLAPRGEDSVRVGNAMAGFAQALQECCGDSPASARGSEASLNAGMLAIAGRYARQIAAAFAKRILHGSLNCSNIALDGRFLDFGTTTSVPAYHRRSGAPPPAGPDLWGQAVGLEMALRRLRQHVLCYLPDLRAAGLVSAGELLSHFHEVLRERMQMELLKLTGIGEDGLASLPQQLRLRAFRCLKEVYSRGASARFVWRGDGDPTTQGWPAMSSTGRHDLNAVMRQALPAIMGRAGPSAGVCLQDEALGHKITSSIRELVATHAERSGPPSAADRLHEVLERSARLNHPVDFLTRESLDRTLEPFESQPAGLAACIGRIVNEARLIMDERAQVGHAHPVPRALEHAFAASEPHAS